MKLWASDERFIPDSVTFHDHPGEYKPTPPDWRWGGGITQSGGDLYVRLFHSWTKLDQQTLLENAVGKIFSVGSAYNKTVIQLHGTDVAVKHRDLKVLRRFSSKSTLLANLFNALITMVEVEWLPQYKSKDGRYYYSSLDKDDADNTHEMEMLVSAKKALESAFQYAPKEKIKLLPDDDPFSGTSMDHGS